MSSDKPQPSKTPILLKTLLGKIHFTAREIGNPESFQGVVFFKADKTERGRPDSYHVLLNNTTELTQDQINRIVDIINESRPSDQKFVVESKPRKQRTYNKTKGIPLVMNQPTNNNSN